MYDLVPIADDFFCAAYTGNSWPTSSNIYLIVDPDGLTMIDAGIDNAACFTALSSCLKKLGRHIQDIHTILLTHGHPDHAGGVNAILRKADPRILIPEDSIPEAVDPQKQDYYCLPPQTRSIATRMRDFDILDNFNRTCGNWILDRTRLTGIRDGDRVEIGAYGFDAIQTPGHDIGLMCFYEAERKILLTGDLLRSTGPGSALPWYTSSAGGVDQYLASLAHVNSLQVETTLPAHGALTGTFQQLVQETQNVILERESAILKLLQSGPMTCEHLDAHLYRPIVLKLCPWFSTVTESHLSRLEKAEIVKRNGIDYFLPSHALTYQKARH